jgi:hypothetical protein
LIYAVEKALLKELRKKIFGERGAVWTATPPSV